MIVCPACRGTLKIHRGTGTLPETTGAAVESIRCCQCRRSYPIEDGIPVLLIERAQNE
ncbi:MAG TPA: Trm112 family protein [Silvibacterium sp.]|nr:Trm112 family protein [Silvibacterium sp.]